MIRRHMYIESANESFVLHKNVSILIVISLKYVSMCHMDDVTTGSGTVYYLDQCWPISNVIWRQICHMFPAFLDVYVCVCVCKYMCEWKQNFKHCNACYNESNRMCRECSPKLFLVCKLRNFRLGRYTFIGIWVYWYTEASNRLFYDDYTVHRGSYIYHPR